MASGSIKGITIKLGADASELTSALHQIDKELSSAQKGLRAVNNDLKFDSGNTELLKQKMVYLKKAISENDAYVKKLKEALAQMKAKGVDETSEEFMALERAILKAERQGNSFKNQLNETQAKLNQTDSGLKKVNSSLKNVDTIKATNSLNTMKVAMGNLIAQGIMRLSSAITNNLGAAISRSDTLANFPKVMEGMGISASSSEKAVKKLAKGIEGLPTTLDDATNGVKQFAAVNGDVNKSTQYFIALNNAVAAGGAAADIQSTALEQLSQAYAKGKPDMQEWRAMMTAMPAQLGQVAKSMGMTTSELGEGLRNGSISMDDFMQKIVELNKTGGDGFESFSEQAKGATGGISTSLSTMGTAVTSGMQQVIDAIGRDNISTALSTIKTAIKSFFDVVVNVITFLQSHSDIVVPIITALATFAGVITTVVAALRIWTAVQTALNIVMAMNPVLLIVAGIIALIAALVIAYKKSETFRSIIQALGNVFKSLALGVATAVANIIMKFKSIINTAKNVANKVKSAFQGIISSMKNIGLNIVKGIGNGITSGVGWIKGKIKSFVGNVKSFLKRLFGINSPSKWARDTIGLGIDEGIAVGITDNQGMIQNAATSMLNATNPSIGSISTEMANAVGTGLAVAGTGGSTKPIQITVNLGGAKVAEQIFKLNKQGQAVLQG